MKRITKRKVDEACGLRRKRIRIDWRKVQREAWRDAMIWGEAFDAIHLEVEKQIREQGG